VSDNPKDPFIDIEAERAVISALLADPERIPEYGELSPELFAIRGHQLFGGAILAVHAAGQEVNQLSVCEWLRDKRSHGGQGNQLAEAGGASALMKCDNAAALNPKGVAEQLVRLRDLALRRQARTKHHRAREALFDFSRPAEEVILESAGELATLGHAQVTGFKTAREFLLRELDKIDATQRGTEAARYILTGIRLWDECVGGLPRGELTIIAAQPGVGKSSLGATMALSIAEGDADRIAEEVAYFSLEDQGGWAGRRWLAERAEVSIGELLRKGLDPARLDKVWSAGADLGREGGPLDRIFINDERGLTAPRVAAAARQIIAQRGLRVVFVDHLLEMLDFGDVRSRDERIGEILRTLRDLAVQCNVAVVLFTHLKDPDDARVDARFIKPKLQDFAGGRFVDRMARVAVGLWFPPTPAEPKPGKEPVALKVPAKATDEQRQKLAEQHESSLRKWHMEYEKKKREWEEKCALCKESLVATVLKATEGESGHDFTMRRIRSAGLVSRTEGGRHANNLGFTPAK
jgi:replicative DNA helicase